MNIMTLTPETDDTARAVLDFLQHQLDTEEPEPVLDSLGRLAGAFEVEAAGLGAMLEAPGPTHAATHVTLALTEASWDQPGPEVLPWDRDPLLLGRLKESGEVSELTTADGKSLVARAGSHGLDILDRLAHEPGAA